MSGPPARLPLPVAASSRVGWRPTEAQRLLLRAALLPDSRAVAAWSLWRQQVALDDIDSESFRLLPLLVDNLGRLGVGGEGLDRCRGVTRYTWSKNQLLLARARPVITKLQEVGLPVLALKGLALATRYYRSIALRPMNDIDILIPTERAQEGREVLAALGWRPMQQATRGSLPYLHGLGYTDGEGGEIDLHWHALWESRGPGADESSWRRATPIDVAAMRLMTLDPTHQVIHLAAHGVRCSVNQPIHWLADLDMVIREEGRAIRWDPLVRMARSRGLQLQTADALEWVARHLDVQVPGSVCAGLRSERVPLGGRLEYRLRQSPTGPIGGLLLHWCDYRRLMPDRSFLRRLLGFPTYLSTLWDSTVWRLPIVAASKLSHRLRS